MSEIKTNTAILRFASALLGRCRKKAVFVAVGLSLLILVGVTVGRWVYAMTSASERAELRHFQCCLAGSAQDDGQIWRENGNVFYMRSVNHFWGLSAEAICKIGDPQNFPKQTRYGRVASQRHIEGDYWSIELRN